LGKFTKAESTLLRGIVETLTLDRYTDNEIIYFLKERHNINIDKSSVCLIRKKMEKDGKKWYEQLRQSDYKYIYTYKIRIDSLIRYQHRLNEILNKQDTSDFLKIKAITELHKIEISLAKLYGNLPDVVGNNNELLSMLESKQSTTISNKEESEQPTIF
jgi:hypothetical protein